MYSFIETRLFTKLVGKYLTDEEYENVQSTLIRNPEAGTLIPGSGGVRKNALASRRAGQAGWRSHHLLRAHPTRVDLDADDLREERYGEYFREHAS